MKKPFKWLAVILVSLVSFYGLYLLIIKGITSFKTKDLAGIVIIVGIVIYFVFKVVEGIKKDSKNLDKQ